MGTQPERLHDNVLLAALRRWAREADLNQSDIADRTGISQSTLSRYLLDRSVHRLQQATVERLTARIPGRLLREEQARAAGRPGGRREQRDTPVVFVSSTYLDNVERRTWVREAIERAGMTALAMERWTANPRATTELCTHRIAEADVFLCLLAWRYGWIPEGEDKSITEIEYEEAGRLGVPRLVFLIDQPLEHVNVTTDFDADDRWRKQGLLERFKARARAEQTALPFRDTDLKTVVLQALFEWKEQRAKAAGQPPSPEPAPFEPLEQHEQTLADYLQAVESEHAHVVLPGFESRLRVPLLLDDLFVQVNIGSGEGSGAAADGEDSRKRDKQDVLERSRDATTTLPEALKRVSGDRRRKGLVLLGHPGAGKTTQLRRLALSLVRGQLADLGLAGDMAPVFVPLRKLVTDDHSLGDLVRRLLADDNLGFGPEFAQWLWKRGRLLLLIDGLDEVAKERRAEVKEWIESVSRSGKGHAIVVTCRHEGYALAARLGPEFVELHLRPLDNEQANALVRRWHDAVALGLLPPDAPAREREAAKSRAARDAQDLITRLRDDTLRASHVYQLAHNPLLLSAICLVHRDRGKLPDRAAELYRDTIDVLLQHWREAKKLPVSFEARTARQVLQPVALWLHQVEGRTQASEDEIVEQLQAGFKEAGWREVSPRAFLATVRDESGLLTGWSSESFGFMHLGFQEYLAARQLHQLVLRQAGNAQGFQEEIAKVKQHFGPTWWHEVLCLLFSVDEGGVLFKALAGAILRHPRLAEHEDLARRCIADARRFDAGPFHELLRCPADEDLWANRLVAAKILVERDRQEIDAADLAPALDLLDRPPGRLAALHEQQLAALRLVVLLRPEALGTRAERLARHPHAEVKALAALYARQPEAQARASLAGGSKASGRLSGLAGSISAPRGGCELVLIPGGRFDMGSPEGEAGRWDDEGPQHSVQVEPFYMAANPVTNEEYARFLADNPKNGEPAFWGDRNFNQPRQPVVGVSWADVRAYCEWAGLLLPTEAQWECACRGGTTTPYWSGIDEQDLARVGWYAGNSKGRLHTVGEKPANAFGLFDMHGNIWEWCEDDWSPDYSRSRHAHPGAYRAKGAGGRVVRGGSFGSSAGVARSAYRNHGEPSLRVDYLGFRPAMGITTE